MNHQEQFIIISEMNITIVHLFVRILLINWLYTILVYTDKWDKFNSSTSKLYSLVGIKELNTQVIIFFIREEWYKGK